MKVRSCEQSNERPGNGTSMSETCCCSQRGLINKTRLENSARMRHCSNVQIRLIALQFQAPSDHPSSRIRISSQDDAISKSSWISRSLLRSSITPLQVGIL